MASKEPKLNTIVEAKSRNTVDHTSKYKVAHSEKLGRYLQAAKNLAPGEVILREKPLVVGPMTSGKEYLCFACLRLLPKSKKGAPLVCSKCNVAALCSIACEEQENHHTADECRIFQNNKNLTVENLDKIISVLLPFRLWLLQETEPDLWRFVHSMESHLEKRRNTAVWRDREINVVNVMQELRLIPERETRGDTDFLQRLCGILDVNVFHLRPPGGLEGDLVLHGLYGDASLMAHDCRKNTYVTVDDNFQLTIYASLPIEENEPILINYTASLLDTANRRENLREVKYFECECSLCEDPYEMQSHMSTVLCSQCKTGFMGAENPLAVNPYEKNSRWKCNTCSATIGGHLVTAILNVGRRLIDDIVDDSDIEELETLRKKLSRFLHPNHFLMITFKEILLAAYRKAISSPFPQKTMMENMLDLYKELYNLLDIVEPGLSRLKGKILYEMHVPIVLLANRAHAEREISAAELASRLNEAASTLKKALTMLLLEPNETPEGKLAKRALQELKALNQNIADVKTIAAAESDVY